MLRAATWILAGLPLAAQPPPEARVPFYGQELVYRYSAPVSAGAAPLVVLTEGAWDYWQAGAGARGWSLVAPVNIAPAATDTYAKALEAIVTDAIKRVNTDPLRVYLAGTGRGVAAVLYARGRVPHLWAAAFAANGDPGPAIDSNRLFTANAELVPLLWAGRPDDELAREKLRLAGYPFQWRDAARLQPGEEANYLASRARPANPPRIDCETGNLAFARCYWLEIARPDPARRNDVLTRSRVTPGSGAFLALGGFGYDPAAGPGVVVSWFPDNYSGPLKPGDRIVSVGGTNIADGRAYARFMDQARDEKPVAVVVQRGKQRVRIETRIVLPKRDENITARARAEWTAESRELLIVSRGVGEMRIDLPAAWVPATINWNGQEVLQAGAPGCWIVADASRRCPAQ
jgi:hypothetical protein